MARRANPNGGRLWACPRCGRRFARAKQWHSCRARTIDAHFRGKDPKLRSMFDSLCRALKRRGPLRVDAVESTINLAGKHHFGGIAVRRTYLRVGFLASREIEDKRILRAERIGPRRVAHHVAVRSLDDVDDQLLGWLADAQALRAGLVDEGPGRPVPARASDCNHGSGILHPRPRRL